MKTNAPHLPKTNRPDSEETARDKHPFTGDEQMPDASTDIEGLQTSNKAGKHSSAEKLAASRPEFGARPGAKPVDGAFGADSNRPAPQTNQFRCNACGRYFNTEDELTGHERECRLAKQTTPAGRNALPREDATLHPKNDTGR